jgi:hypothetical protein
MLKQRCLGWWGALALMVLVTCSLASAAEVDTRRNIALPVKAKRTRRQAPAFLRRMSFTREKGFSIACSACEHYVQHFVRTLQDAEKADPTSSTSGWRMDERRTVGFRGQDGKMMALWETVCQQFYPRAQYKECEGIVCATVPAQSKYLKEALRRNCEEFREEFEDALTKKARAGGEDSALPRNFCIDVHACTGEENTEL